MHKKLTKEQVVDQFRKAHGDRYDYTEFEYLGDSKKSTIICAIHGRFQQPATTHKKGVGCPSCGGSAPLDTGKFISGAKAVHGERYDYSPTQYTKMGNKVMIRCRSHGVFTQLAKTHAKGGNCPMCHKIRMGRQMRSVAKKKTMTTEDAISKFKITHGERYDYGRVDYVRNCDNVVIVCKEHGPFCQPPARHWNGSHCPHCVNDSKRKSAAQCINDFKRVHGDLYDYSIVEYRTAVTPVSIICKTHGIFKQPPNAHLSGKGCPKCQRSHGEISISRFLDKNNIKYVEQKRFDSCRHIKPLPFDFYLPDFNLCIEFQGEGHYEPMRYEGAKEKFEQVKTRDQIKRRWCAFLLNPNLLEINYWEDAETKIENYLLARVDFHK